MVAYVGGISTGPAAAKAASADVWKSVMGGEATGAATEDLPSVLGQALTPASAMANARAMPPKPIT